MPDMAPEIIFPQSNKLGNLWSGILLKTDLKIKERCRQNWGNLR